MHVALFGTYGVGKTALIRRHVDASRLLFVECLPGQQAPEVYRAILAEAGARVRTETRLSKKKRLTASLKFLSGGVEQGTENTEAEVTIDLGHVGDVFRTLAHHKKRPLVVLHDFNRLTRVAQRQIVKDFQYVFEQTEARFVVVGDWSSSAYLTDLNERLPSFLTSVQVTAWRDDELSSVLSAVANRLRITIPEDARASLITMSAGSIRELVEMTRLLLDGSGDTHRSQLKTVPDAEQVQAIARARTARLFGRYRSLLSTYFATKICTTDGMDVEEFLLQTMDDLLQGGDDDGEDDGDDGPREEYSFDEVKEAFDIAVQEYNTPRLEEQLRRKVMIERLADAARRDGGEVSVSFESLSGVVDTDLEERIFRATSRALVRKQERASFNPPLVAYDPHARTLVALEPKLRSFLRNDIGDAGALLNITPLRVDDRRFQRYSVYRWHDWIRDAARLVRWRKRHDGAGDASS
jgi:hypothetical protein